MLSPLTKVLVKIFSNGFYKVHAGLLVTLFATAIIYFIFINVSDQSSLSPDEQLYYNLSLVLEFVSNPVIMGIVFIFWLLYTVKSWQYVAGQLLLTSQQFLFYSSTSLNKAHQFRSWFMVQLVIMLPIIGYGLFAFTIGFIFGHLLFPAITLLYIFLLTGISAFLYVRLINRLAKPNTQNYLFKITYKWEKPFFSLFLYHVFDNMKVSFVLTKIISGITVTGILYFFSDVSLDLRVANMAVLAVIMVHAVLIFQEHRFNETYMGFSRNLPLSRGKLFTGFIGIYLLILLPEFIWISTRFSPPIAISLSLLGLSIALLFRNLLYWLGLNMQYYLKWVGGLFFLFQFLIMYDFFWSIILLNFLLSFSIFYIYYYQYKPGI
jgi:hypothetical protein